MILQIPPNNDTFSIKGLAFVMKISKMCKNIISVYLNVISATFLSVLLIHVFIWLNFSLV